MKYILKSIFSLILICSVNVSMGQENKTKTEKDSVVIKKERYGLRAGIDAYRLGRSFLDKNYQGFEIMGDIRWKKNLYFAGEFGNENLNTNETRMEFTTKGTYFKVGMDYNMYQNWLDMENIISLGGRIGFSSFSQQLHRYKIYNRSNYFEDEHWIDSEQKFDGLHATWLEIVAGLKAQVFKNVFVGFSLRLNALLSNKKPETFDNLYIPGFNRTYDGTFGVGFNYGITYLLPIYKKKIEVHVEKKEKKK